MTLKTFYPKLLWNTLVKRCWFGAAAFLLMFIVMPLNAMLSFESAEELLSYNNGYINNESMSLVLDEQKEFVEFICGGNMGIGVLVIGLALMGAWSGLAWLHSRKQMDLYGSLPVKREVLYGMECATVIIWYLVSHVINVVLTLLVAVQKEIFTVEALKFGISGIGTYLLMFLSAYFWAAVAMMLTGKVLTGILGTVVLLGVLPAVALLLAALPDIFFVSYVSTSGIWYHLAIYLSPVVVCFETMSEILAYANQYSEIYAEWLPIAVQVFWLVAGAVVSVVLLKIRPAEGAEQSMVFPKTEGLIKGIILYPIAIGGGLFFWGMADNYGEHGWLWFGMIFVVFVISILIEIIYHHDRKRIFGHKLSTGIATVAAALTILLFQFDLLGMDSWIPEKDDIESMILISDLTYAYCEYPDGSHTSEGYLRNNIDEAKGECIYEYLPEGLALIKKYQAMQNGDAQAEEYFDRHGWGESVTVVFKMKNGLIKERRYRLSSESMDELCKELFKEEIYREAWLPLIMAEDNKYQVQSIDYKGVYIDTYDWSVKEKKEFVNIYKEELKMMTYEQIFEDNDSSSSMDFEDDNGAWLYGNYPLSENFVKSIAYLESVEGSLDEMIANVEKEWVEKYTEE